MQAIHTPEGWPIIAAADDVRVRPFVQAYAQPCRDPIIVEGTVAVLRLLQGGQPVQAILTTPAASLQLRAQLRPDCTVWVASPAVLRTIVGYPFHRGTLALAPRPVPPVRTLWPQDASCVVLACGLADPANVGAVVRTARVLGATDIWVDVHGADPYSRRATRAAMGYNLVHPVASVEPGMALKNLTPGVAVVAATCGPQATSLPAFMWPKRCVVCVGNEGAGLPDAIEALAHHRVQIPMVPYADSLNVGAALAVLLYDRRLKTAGTHGGALTSELQEPSCPTRNPLT